ncbi:MAG TPA: DUF3828 domain-containing protein [Bryobacteraceae bacterium]|nr:DUF3828 domain-containing protein [Bryobacteraceae bacterium]
MTLRATIVLFSAVLVLPAASRIDDPKSFVTAVYQHYIADSKEHPYAPPDDIYTARLKKLFQADKKKAKGEVGCLDFDFWVNGQDWTITNLTVTSADQGQDQKTVIAKFVNLGEPEEIHFDFRRNGNAWLLDDVQSVMANRWSLSEIMKCVY